MSQSIIDKLISNIPKDNIAEDVEEDKLNLIGGKVSREYDFDKLSRIDWEEAMEEALVLARQVKEGRTWAGDPVSDVKYPVIAAAAIQYAARAYPAIIKDGEIAKHKIIGRDEGGIKAARGMRVSTHLNWQICEKMVGWEDDMDQLLVSHSILGTYFKKTYHDPIEGGNVSESISPEDLVVHNGSKSLESAPRKTHLLEYTHNEYLERVNAGIWLDIDLKRPMSIDTNEPHLFLEQHTLYDLDDDDYEEPYVITIHKDTQKVVRITARYSEAGIRTNGKDLVKIVPIEYFTEFPFMPAFDGSFYRMGFGILLGPLNHAVNTIFNQLLDAGKRANRQSGFLGKNVRLLRGGESGVIKFRDGEWKVVQSTGDDLRKAIVPLPVSEPSPTLFQLLGLLLEASKEVASRSELLSGQQSQQNVPATTTLALIEQGLKVFSGIYKRVYRGLRKELVKLRNLNELYSDEIDSEYKTVLDDPEASSEDYRSSDYDIYPASTSASITETQKYLKAQAVREWYRMGLNDQEIAKYYFEALEIPDSERFLNVPPPQPPPEFQIKMAELKLKREEVVNKRIEFQLRAKEVELKEMEMHHKGVKMQSEAIKNLAEAESKEAGSQLGFYKSELSEANKRVMGIDQAIKEFRIAQEQNQSAEEQARIKSQGMQNRAQGMPSAGQQAMQQEGMPNEMQAGMMGRRPMTDIRRQG